jgi:hypothetical protein
MERSDIESEARAVIAQADALPDQPAPEPKKKATPAKAKVGKQAKLDS